MNPVRLVLLAAVAVVLTACGTALAPAPNLSGVWFGIVTNTEGPQSTTMLLTLEDGGGFLGGSVVVGGLVQAEVSGVRDASHLTLDIGDPFAFGTTLSATFTRDRISGTYSFPGGPVSTVALTRQ